MGDDQYGVFFYKGLMWIWVSESVGEVFGGFEINACIIPVPNSDSQIGWLGFTGRYMVQMAE